MGVFILFRYRFVVGYFQKFHICLLGFDFVMTIKTPPVTDVTSSPVGEETIIKSSPVGEGRNTLTTSTPVGEGRFFHGS